MIAGLLPSAVLRRGHICRVLILLLALQPGIAAAEQKLVINTTARAPHYFEDGTGFFNRLVDEIFNRLDLEHELIWLPAERSLVFTDNGTVDGVVPRAAAIEAGYPNLVRVPEDVFKFEFMAYTRDPGIKVDGWASLAPHTVGYINGWKIVENNIVDVNNAVPVNSYQQLLTLLNKGRVDVAILDRVMGGWVAQQLEFDLQLQEPPLNVEPTYFYLHSKHRALVPEIGNVIAEMKRDGSYREIFLQTLGGFATP